MLPIASFLLLGSAVFFVCASLYWLIRLHRSRWFAYGIAVAAAAVLLQLTIFGWPAGPANPDIVPQGEGGAKEESAVPYLWLYGAMLAGMLAQAAHDRFARPRQERPPFDPGVFLAPVFISPIVFLPLYEGLPQSRAAGKTLFLLCLVAFENGFFFKNYLDQRHGKSTPKSG